MKKQEFLDLVLSINARLTEYARELRHDFYSRQRSCMDPIGTREQNFLTATDSTLSLASRLYRDVSQMTEEWAASSRVVEQNAEKLRRLFIGHEARYFEIKKDI